MKDEGHEMGDTGDTRKKDEGEKLPGTPAEHLSAVGRNTEVSDTRSGESKKGRPLPEEFTNLDIGRLSPEEITAKLEALKRFGWWAARGGKRLSDHLAIELVKRRKNAAAGIGDTPILSKPDAPTDAAVADEGAIGVNGETGADDAGDVHELSDDEVDAALLEIDAKNHRDLFGFPKDMNDEVFRASIFESRLRRLGLGPNASAEAVAKAEAEWTRREEALEEPEDDNDEVELIPFYTFYGLPRGSGIAGIRRAQERVQIEKEAPLEPFLTKSPSPDDAQDAAAAADTVDVVASPASPSPDLGKAEVREPYIAKEEIRTIIADALRDTLIGERYRLRNERGVLKRIDKGLLQKNELPADTDPLWWALANIYRGKIHRGSKDPRHIDRLARSYHELVDRRGMLDSPDQDSETLSLIARSRSLDEALTIFRRLEAQHGDVTSVEEKESTTTKTPLVEHIGEMWFDNMRGEAQEAEQDEKRVRDADPEYLGFLQRAIESPRIPETLEGRLRAADEYIHILRGEKPVPQREAELRPERIRQRGTMTTWRNGYAEALHSRSLVFGRSSTIELTKHREQYQGAVEEQIGARINEIAGELRDAELIDQRDPAREAEIQAGIVELMLSSRMEEENALRQSLRVPAERVAASRTREFWKKHRVAHAAVALGLAGVAVTGAALKFNAASAIATGVALPMAGMVERAWRAIDENFGDAKVLSKQKIRGFSDHELEKKLAAHTVAAVGFPGTAYEKQEKRKETISELLREYERRKEAQLAAEIGPMREQGKSAVQIVESLMLHSMNEQLSLHRAYEGKYEAKRSQVIRRWVLSSGAGIMIGVLTGNAGTSHLRRFVRAH